MLQHGRASTLIVVVCSQLDRLKKKTIKKNQNIAARIVFKSPKHCHVSPLLRSVHWPSVTKRIDYKLSSLCFSDIDGTGPEYLSELLSIFTPSRQVRSASDTRLFGIPTFKTKDKRTKIFFVPSRFCVEQSPSNC